VTVRVSARQDELIKSCTVIGYPGGQDGAILPAWNYPPCPARKISPKAISLIDQACSVKMAGLTHSFLASLFMDLDCVSVHEHTKKELVSSHFDLTLGQ